MSKSNHNRAEAMTATGFPEEALSMLRRKYSLSFKDEEVLVQALTHSSFYLNLEKAKQLERSNERMAVFGDAVLDLVATEHLYNTSMGRKGELDDARKRLVNDAKCRETFKQLGVEGSLRVSPDLRNTGDLPESVLSDAYEALVCAIYLDQGYEKAAGFVHKTIIAPTPPQE